jgi:indolepyruvate ferredoxin oxidoreductase
MAGLAQKGGAVFTHIRIAERPDDIHAVRIAAGGAKLLLGCDIVVAGAFDSLAKIDAGTTRAVVNSHTTMTGDFTRQPDLDFPAARLAEAIESATGKGACDFIDATRIATTLIGDSIATNLFMLGYAFQKGLIPIGGAAIERAIELNEASVEANKQAFLWGRRMAADRAAVERIVAEAAPEQADHRASTGIEDIVARRALFLTDYQDASYAERYRAFVERVRGAEARRTPGRQGLAVAVARYYFKLLAYKDEYEVARLFSNGDFLKQVEAQFEGDYRLEFHLAPPLVAERDPDTGRPVKRRYGQGMLRAFGLLARLKRLRGGPLDIFGYSAERRRERKLIGDYEGIIEEIIGCLDHDNHGLAVEIASLPEHIRGYGHVKEAHLVAAGKREGELLAAFRAPAARPTAAE